MGPRVICKLCKRTFNVAKDGPASVAKAGPATPVKTERKDRYNICKDSLRCHNCGEEPVISSNLAIAEEVARLTARKEVSDEGILHDGPGVFRRRRNVGGVAPRL
jgi:cytochrome c-type biogenesis protein CcmH/NrfF